MSMPTATTTNITMNTNLKVGRLAINLSCHGNSLIGMQSTNIVMKRVMRVPPPKKAIKTASFVLMP